MMDDHVSEYDKQLLYPDDRYQAEGMRQVEHQALQVLKEIRRSLPGVSPLDIHLARTRDSLQIDCGEEGVTFIVTLEALEIRHPFTEWTCGSYGPAFSSKLWRRIEWRDLEGDALAATLKKGVHAHHRRFKTCVHCLEPFGPGHYMAIDDRIVCHGCASAHEGVVF